MNDLCRLLLIVLLAVSVNCAGEKVGLCSGDTSLNMDKEATCVDHFCDTIFFEENDATQIPCVSTTHHMIGATPSSCSSGSPPFRMNCVTGWETPSSPFSVKACSSLTPTETCGDVVEFKVTPSCSEGSMPDIQTGYITSPTARVFKSKDTCVFVTTQLEGVEPTPIPGGVSVSVTFNTPTIFPTLKFTATTKSGKSLSTNKENVCVCNADDGNYISVESDQGTLIGTTIVAKQNTITVSPKSSDDPAGCTETKIVGYDGSASLNLPPPSSTRTVTVNRKHCNNHSSTNKVFTLVYPNPTFVSVVREKADTTGTTYTVTFSTQLNPPTGVDESVSVAICPGTITIVKVDATTRKFDMKCPDTVTSDKFTFTLKQGATPIFSKDVDFSGLNPLPSTVSDVTISADPFITASFPVSSKDFYVKVTCPIPVPTGMTVRVTVDVGGEDSKNGNCNTNIKFTKNIQNAGSTVTYKGCYRHNDYTASGAPCSAEKSFIRPGFHVTDPTILREKNCDNYPEVKLKAKVTTFGTVPVPVQSVEAVFGTLTLGLNPATNDDYESSDSIVVPGTSSPAAGSIRVNNDLIQTPFFSVPFVKLSDTPSIIIRMTNNANSVSVNPDPEVTWGYKCDDRKVKVEYDCDPEFGSGYEPGSCEVTGIDRNVDKSTVSPPADPKLALTYTVISGDTSKRYICDYTLTASQDSGYAVVTGTMYLAETCIEKEGIPKPTNFKFYKYTTSTAGDTNKSGLLIDGTEAEKEVTATWTLPGVHNCDSTNESVTVKKVGDTGKIFTSIPSTYTFPVSGTKGTALQNVNINVLRTIGAQTAAETFSTQICYINANEHLLQPTHDTTTDYVATSGGGYYFKKPSGNTYNAIAPTTASLTSCVNTYTKREKTPQNSVTNVLDTYSTSPTMKYTFSGHGHNWSRTISRSLGTTNCNQALKTLFGLYQADEVVCFLFTSTRTCSIKISGHSDQMSSSCGGTVTVLGVVGYSVTKSGNILKLPSDFDKGDVTLTYKLDKMTTPYTTDVFTTTVYSLSLPTDLTVSVVGGPQHATLLIIARGETLEFAWQGTLPSSSFCKFKYTFGAIDTTDENKVTRGITSMITEDQIKDGTKFKASVQMSCESTEMLIALDTTLVSWERDVCERKKPEAPADVLTCNNCATRNGKLWQHETMLNFTIKLTSEGKTCTQPYLRISSDEYLLKADFAEEVTLIKSIELPEADYAKQFEDKTINIEVIAADFVIKTLEVYHCLVPKLTSVPRLKNSLYNYLTLPSATSDEPFVVSFTKIAGLYSPCNRANPARYEVTLALLNALPKTIPVDSLETDLAGDEGTATFTVNEPGAYTFSVSAVSASGEIIQSDTRSLSVCFGSASAPRPTQKTPDNESIDIDVAGASFTWEPIPGKQLALRCSATDVANFALLVKRASEPDDAAFVAGTAKLEADKVTMAAQHLLALKTQYNWKLAIVTGSMLASSADSFQYTNSSSWYTFTTVAKSCRYQKCSGKGSCNEDDVTCTCFEGFKGDTCERTSGLTGGEIGIIVACVSVATVIVLIIIFIILKRSQFFSLKMPDFGPFMFLMPKGIDTYNSNNNIPESEIERRIAEDPTNGFKFAISVLAVTPITEADNVSRAFVYAFERNGQALECLLRLIEHEVTESDSPNTLFRSNSAATKFFKVYNRLVGLPYLFRVLAPLLTKLLKDEEKVSYGVEVKGGKGSEQLMTAKDAMSKLSESYEINPNMVADADELESMIEANALSIQLTCQMFLSTVSRTSSYCPPEFRKMCSCIKANIKRKYPSHAPELALSAFMFLRYFVAGLSVPETFGILDKAPSQNLRRQLILISKVLSNLSTQVKFGEKEDYMVVMNDFLETNKNALTPYYELLCDDEEIKLATHVSVPDKYYNGAIETLSVAAGLVEGGEWAAGEQEAANASLY